MHSAPRGTIRAVPSGTALDRRPHHDTQAVPLSADVAAAYDVSVKSVRRWIATGDLPAYHVGTQVRVRAVDAEQLAKPIPAGR